MTANNTIKLKIQGLDCADCALTLERGVGQLDGIQEITVNFNTETLHAVGTLDPQAIVRRVRALGYDVAAETKDNSTAHKPQTGIIGFIRYLTRSRATLIALIGALLLLLTLPLALLDLPAWSGPLLRGLHVLIALTAGFENARSGLRALILSRKITIDLLMTIAAAGALLIGETGEAATVVVLFAVGEALEGYSGERSRDALRSLLALKPERATVLRPCIDCAGHLGKDGYSGGPCPFCPPHEVTVGVEAVEIGETVLVRPGERIPLDGRILSGASLIDQAAVTGESVPVLRSAGDEVYAGTVNGEAALEIKVTRCMQDSTISRIVRLVEQAQAQRAPVERFIDRFAAWYTPAIVLTAALVAVVPPLFFGTPLLDTAEGRGWLYRALSILLVGCPCALVISTPVTMVSAMSALARRGVLVKGGAFLDALARVRTFALDKTGTLTRGRPTVQRTHSQACTSDDDRCAGCDEMLALAAAVERRSEHPLAQAIVAEAAGRDVLHRYPAAEGVQALAGRGVQGRLGAETITVGSHALFHEQAALCADFHLHIAQAETDGQTVMLVGKDNHVVGFVGVADEPRPTTGEALRALKRALPRAQIAMLTGDSPGVAERIAGQIGSIDRVYAGLLPDEKLALIRKWQETATVAMIGDGVNDAPALAAADVGIAMGGAGTAQAMETANVVLMRDELTHLADAVQTSRRARRAIAQNIWFSLAIKAAVFVLALGGWATLWMAVVADVGASIAVTLNGMRRLRAGPVQE